jgi:hypothetical protein
MRRACASIARSASKGFLNPYARAVPGMNWAMPCAPAGERANGLKFDSAYSCAASRSIGTLCRRAALAIGSWKRGGTKLGRPWWIRP